MRGNAGTGPGYDTVFDAIAEDAQLVALLRAQAARHGLENRKESFADIQRNIEDRILRDALAHVPKITSNYPRTPIAIATIKAVLDWPDSRDEVYQIIDDFLRRATAVDGVTGEKGLANYSAFGPQSIAMFLGTWDRAIPGFLEEMFRRHPKLHDMYRFHVDTWCFTQYYPLVGDSGWFAARHDQYQGVRFQRPGRESVYSHKDPVLSPSMFRFMDRLYELTEDPAFVQVLYLANGRSVAGLPHDVFAADPAAFRSRVSRVIADHGDTPPHESVNKQQWRIALLKSGAGADSRVAWLNYEAGGGHGHLDGMNLGLFALGLDLMPDFGYPPVQFGGWGSPRSRWYQMTAAHNTVVVDGRNQAAAAGTTTLWKDGPVLKAVRASCPAMIGGQQYERTVASVDVGPAASTCWTCSAWWAVESTPSSCTATSQRCAPRD
jgi:oligo-alginate lyase